MDHYPITIKWSGEDSGYIAIATDLPGCSAFGETREDAAREIGLAIEAWCEAAWKAGNSVPAPSVTL